MDNSPERLIAPYSKPDRTSWLRQRRTPLLWAGLVATLLLLAWALPQMIRTYNSTGRCLSSFSTISETEMKRRVVKSYVKHRLQVGKQWRLRVMFLGRSISEKELIERSQSETLLDLLKEQPLLLKDEDQLDQFATKIDSGDFTILYHFPDTTYHLVVLPGKSLYKVDPAITTEFFKNNKYLELTGGKFNIFGNYLYEYEMYNLDTTCCGARRQSSKEEIVEAKKQNLAQLNFRKRFPEHRWSLPVSNCGSVWFPPPPNDNRTNFLFE